MGKLSEAEVEIMKMVQRHEFGEVFESLQVIKGTDKAKSVRKKEVMFWILF